MTIDIKRAQLEALWYRGYPENEEYEFDPEWAETIDVYIRYEEENGRERPVVYYKDSGSKEWISSDKFYDLMKNR